MATLSAITRCAITRCSVTLCAITLCAMLASCAADNTAFTDKTMDAAVFAGSGHHLRGHLDPAAELPPGIDLADGLTTEEAVAIALWRNPAFAATLAELGVTREVLAESGLLQNPVLSMFFPVGPKQLEFTVTWPIESLLRRSARIAAARADCEQVAARLLAHGLDLARDVRLAMIELRLQREREVIAGRAAAVAEQLAGAAARRLAAGDVSETDAAVARADAVAAVREHLRRGAAVAQATERVWQLLAYRPPGELRLAPPANDLPAASLPSSSRLTANACAARPDLRAAELALDAACARAGLTGWDVARLSLLIDANAKGQKGFELGPGLLAEVPAFHGFASGSRAAAVTLAARRRDSVRRQVEDEVIAAALEVRQSQRLATLQERQLGPLLRERVELLRRQVAAGQEAESAVLPAQAAVLQSEVDRAEARAAYQRALVNLERAVGCPLPTGADR